MRPVCLECTEKAFQAQVTQVAKMFGWRCYHPYLSIHSERGFPDCTLVKAGRGVIFAELKRENGKLTSHQEEWIAALKEADQTVYVWRPSMWEEIVAELRGMGR